VSCILTWGTNTYNSLAAAVADGAPVIKYGAFLTNILDFLIIAVTLYIVITFILKRKKDEEAQAA